VVSLNLAHPVYIAVRCKVHLVGYLHSFSRYCLPNLRNHAKFTLIFSTGG